MHHHIHPIVLRFSVFITDPLGPATMVLLTKPTRQIIQKVQNTIINVYRCFSFCLLICRSNILFNRTNIFRDKTSFHQFLTWLLPGLKKMLILIISNTEGVKVLVCPAIFFFWTLMGNGNNYQCWYMADVVAIFCG